MSSFHYLFGRLKGFLREVSFEALSASPGEGWYEVARKTGTENIGGYAHNSTGVEHGIDATLTMIAHKQTTKLQASSFESAGLIVPEFNLLVIVF